MKNESLLLNILQGKYTAFIFELQKNFLLLKKSIEKNKTPSGFDGVLFLIFYE